ncbi:MAG TPA: hypothetical protein VFI09_05765 [Solirubrobacterales bacterium]|nr:hypothetical protein [Solirubrobacterales bacterium]
MYVIPLIVIVLIALAIFFSPILAVIILILALIGLGFYKFLGPGTEPEREPPPAKATPTADAPEARNTPVASEDEESGMWGEKWPEQRSGEEPS